MGLGPPSSGLLWTAVVLLGLTVPIAAVIGGSVVAGVALPLALGGVYVLWRAPLRLSLATVLLLVLVSDAPSDRFAEGRVVSPLEPLGRLLLTNLNKTLPVEALKFGVLDLLFAFLLGVVVYRRTHHITLDGAGQVRVARPLAQLAVLAIAFLGIAWAYGLVSGGELQPSLWQVQKLVYLPVLLLLFDASFRGPADHGLLARMLVAAACFKALVALFVRLRIAPGQAEPMDYATTHSDSLLFASAAVVLMARLFEQWNVRNRTLVALVAPILVGGMVANTRRIVWVEVGFSLLTFLLLMRSTRAKRGLLRAGALLAPVAVLYLAVGWSSGSRVFAPVQTLKSIVSSETNRSTATRDVENFNLITTLRTNLVLGTGFGHPYIEHVKQDDISRAFPAYRHVPHNSVLGLWAFSGIVGFTGLWLLLGGGVFFAVRAYHHALDARDRAAALGSIGTIVIYVVHGWGDMGLVSWMGIFLTAAALTVAGKLAVAVGAWPGKPAV